MFHHFGNKGYSLFACLGREVVCSVLSVATLTYASAESVSTDPVVTDSTATTTAREMMLEEVSVTGSRAPLTKSQAAKMVTVLDRADIAQAPVQSINDLLKYAVGVDVRQRGPIGAQTDISIRGGTQDQIILLLNGINICDPQTGHNAMDLPVDLSDIVRIEVLEGPAGRIYGTSSLVGAINIVTGARSQESEDRSNVQAHIEGGSYGYLNVGARYSHSSLLTHHFSLFTHSTRTSAARRLSIRDNMRTRISGCTGTSALPTKAGAPVPSMLLPSGRPTTSMNIPRNSTQPFRDRPNGDGCIWGVTSTGTRTRIATRGIADSPRRCLTTTTARMSMG